MIRISSAAILWGACMSRRSWESSKIFFAAKRAKAFMSLDDWESDSLFCVSFWLFFCLCVWMLLLLTAADGQVNSCVRDHQVHTISASEA